MKKMLDFYGSTLGKKVVVALTGLILFSFVIGHMAGNLKTFAGVSASGVHKLDIYAHFLRTFGSEMAGYAGVLWFLRIGLLGAFVLHVVTVAQLSIRNKAARGGEYKMQKYRASSVASRSMALGGIVIFVFVVFHLAHLTFGWVQPETFVHGHVFANVSAAFRNPAFVFVYCVALIFLGLHLFHGLWSLCQTLGIDRPDRNATLRMVAKVLAIVITIGFMAVPLGVFAGLTPEPPQQFLDI